MEILKSYPQARNINQVKYVKFEAEISENSVKSYPQAKHLYVNNLKVKSGQNIDKNT